MIMIMITEIMTLMTLMSFGWWREGDTVRYSWDNFEETKDDDVNDDYDIDNDEDHDFHNTDVDRLVEDNDNNEDADFAINMMVMKMNMREIIVKMMIISWFNLYPVQRMECSSGFNYLLKVEIEIWQICNTGHTR